MNDHNLDDLIIDNIDPKNSKTKSFLTIIALAIVVLIVAIILTKIILKDPNEKALLEDDNTELISPDLTLQSVTKKSEIQKDLTPAPSIKKELSIKPEKTPIPAATVKPKTIEIAKEHEAKLLADKKSLDKQALEEKMAQAKKEIDAKRLAEIKAQQEADSKKIEQEKKKLPTNSGYFIQVGSFTQSPSARFLSVIKNSGFNYQVTAASSNGTKKLLIGPYGTRAEVDTALVRVRDRINKSAFVVKK